MQELKPTDEFARAVVQSFIRHKDVDWLLTLCADAPSLALIVSFEYLIAEAAQDQG